MISAENRKFCVLSAGVGVLYSLSANLLIALISVSPTAGMTMDPEAAAFFLLNPGLLLLLEVLISPIAEEYIFRKWFFGKLELRIRPLYAALLSSAAFAALHMSPVHLVYTFVMGMILCGIYDRRKAILPCILMHFTANLTAVLVDSFQGIRDFFSRNLWWTAAASMAGCLLILYILFVRKEKA